MADPQNTVILRVQLDETDTEKKLADLVLAIEGTKKAQADLSAQRKAGTVDDAKYAAETVKLTNQLTLQRAESRNLTKDLTLYRTAVNGVTDSYEAAQAQLSLAQRQYQGLAGSADNSTESTQALSEIIDGLRTTLKSTDAQQSLFVRQVGGYPEAMGEASAATKVYTNNLVGLKQKLDDLTQQRATADVGTAQFEELNRAILDTRTAIQQAEGKIDEFGDRVQKNSKREDLDTLGDAFGGVTAAIQLSTLALDDQDDAAAVTAKATQFLANAEAARNLQIGLANAKDAIAIGLQQTRNLLFTEQAVAVGATTTATVASTGATVAQTTATTEQTIAQRALNLAMTLNPIGLIVVGVGALIAAYYAWRGASDSTQKKVKDITETVLRFGTPIGLIITGFQKLSEKSETVRQVLGTLGQAFDFVAGKVGNVAREAGEAIGLLDTAAEKSAKASAAAVENSEKEKLSYQLRARELEKAGAAIEQYRSTEREGFAKHLQDMEVDNVRQNAVKADELAAIDAKRAANEKLSKSEQKLFDERREREQKLGEARLALAEFDQTTQDQIVAKAAADAAARKKAFDEAKADGEKQKKLAEQNLKDEYASRAKLLENRQQQIARALELTQRGGEEELTLLREQARNATAIQLAGNSGAQVGAAKKEASALVEARKEIVANGQAEELKRVTDFARRRLQAELQSVLDITTAELAAQQQGNDEVLRLQAQQIEAQRLLAIAGLEANADNTAKLAAINAQAESEQRQAEYAEALRLLNEYIDNKRRAVELDYAKGLTQEGEYQRQLAAVNKASTEAQAAINADYRQSNAENQQKAGDDEVAVAKLTAAETKRAEQAKQQIKEATLQSAQNYTDTLISLFGEESEAGQAAMAIKKVLGVAEIALNLAKQLSANQLASAEIAAIPVVGPALAAAYLAVADVAAITAAAAGTAAILKLEKGGIAEGPSHAQGGIPLFHQGRHAGIEIEGGEPILTANVSRNKTLLAAASAINVAAGGRPLVPSFPGISRMALGGLASPLLREQVQAGLAPEFDYNRLAAAMSKVHIETKVSNIKRGLAKDAYNNSINSF